MRQYTPEGTFTAFSRHLPRLQEMGVETLWFMPITPIGTIKRLGSLGSYYACSSYVQTNPEFGSIADFKALVADAHSRGMKVIIDWVANHTGYGHEWMEGLRRDFYDLSPSGNFRERNGWEDVADLDYGNHDMRRAMIEAMQFWIRECDIDGFRCDMAHLVPLDFWEQARLACDAVKPCFWLAETEHEAYHAVFDASYAWEWMHVTTEFVKSKATLSVLDKVLYKYADRYPKPSWKLFFTSNHDENSWNGTEWEKYGAAALPLAVFHATWDGIPLLYSGQELPNLKRLKFFDKDQIDWNADGSTLYGEFYGKLNKLRRRHPAAGGPNGRVQTQWMPVASERVMMYLRQHQGRRLLVLINLSDEEHQVRLCDERLRGSYTELFSGEVWTLGPDSRVLLQPFGYFVWEE